MNDKTPVEQHHYANLDFEGFEHDAAALEKLFHGLIEWHAGQGLAPDHVQILGKGYRQEYLSLEQAQAKLKKKGFDPVWQFEMNILSPRFNGRVYSWSHQICYREEPHRKYLWAWFKPFAGGLASAAMRDLAWIVMEALAPEYGIGCDHTDHSRMRPHDNQSAGLDPSDIDYRWQRTGAPARVWRRGLQRGVMPHNYLPASALRAAMAGHTLEQWIAADPARGSLTPAPRGLTLWQVDPEHQMSLFLELWKAGLIYDEARHLQRNVQSVVPPTASSSPAPDVKDSKGVGKPEPVGRPSVQLPIKGHKTRLGKRNRLIAKLERHESSASPVVSAEDYFDGNWDEYSLAPNAVGSGRPPLAECRAILQAIGERNDVQAVLVLITEMPDPEEDDDDLWLSSDTVFILSSCHIAEVRKWAKPLHPDEISLVEAQWHSAPGNEANGLDAPPPGAPSLEPGIKVYALWWD